VDLPPLFGAVRAKVFSKPQSLQELFLFNFKSIKLVVMMSAVNLWKALQHASRIADGEKYSRRPNVGIEENSGVFGDRRTFPKLPAIRSTGFPELKQRFFTVFLRGNIA